MQKFATLLYYILYVAGVKLTYLDVLFVDILFPFPSKTGQWTLVLNKISNSDEIEENQLPWPDTQIFECSAKLHLFYHIAKFVTFSVMK